MSVVVFLLAFVMQWAWQEVRHDQFLSPRTILLNGDVTLLLMQLKVYCLICILQLAIYNFKHAVGRMLTGISSMTLFGNLACECPKLNMDKLGP